MLKISQNSVVDFHGNFQPKNLAHCAQNFDVYRLNSGISRKISLIKNDVANDRFDIELYKQ